MGLVDLTVAAESYFENPDLYWEGRGGFDYPMSLNPRCRAYVPEQKAFYRTLIDRVSPKALLDFGCGTGKHFDVWQSVRSVSAYDRSHSMIIVSRETQDKLNTGYSIVFGNSDNRVTLPFQDNQFDLVAACEVFPHILESDISGVIDELSRIMVSGGVIGAVVSRPDHNFRGHSFNHDYEKLFSRDGLAIIGDTIGDVYRYITIEKG